MSEVLHPRCETVRVVFPSQVDKVIPGGEEKGRALLVTQDERGGGSAYLNRQDLNREQCECRHPRTSFSAPTWLGLSICWYGQGCVGKVAVEGIGRRSHLLAVDAGTKCRDGSRLMGLDLRDEDDHEREQHTLNSRWHWQVGSVLCRQPVPGQAKWKWSWDILRHGLP